MARTVRFYRTECHINHFGNVLLEIKESGMRIVSRDNPGQIHTFSWEYLRKVCKCDSCVAESQITGDFV